MKDLVIDSVPFVCPLIQVVHSVFAPASDPNGLFEPTCGFIWLLVNDFGRVPIHWQSDTSWSSVIRSTSSHFTCLEPRSNWSQHKTNGALVHSNSSMNQLLVCYSMTSSLCRRIDDLINGRDMLSRFESLWRWCFSLWSGEIFGTLFFCFFFMFWKSSIEHVACFAYI